ncbi:hypothetical protein RIF29_11261 [Crotalaria pallida]|uniref:Uncharacterized protein n=1 Tax=Crotalaria pallida TaxID=3830 RepID=A0AAN9ILY2_CROPI
MKCRSSQELMAYDNYMKFEYLNFIYFSFGVVEVERIDIGEPENTGMYDRGKGGCSKLFMLSNLMISVLSLLLSITFHLTSTHIRVHIQKRHFCWIFADVDDSGDEVDKAAEALRAQVNAEGREEQTSSSRSSSSGREEKTSSSSSSSSEI